MQLPEKVRKSINKLVAEEKPVRHSFYLYGFEDGLKRGAEIAIEALTPPPGDLVEEMIDEIDANLYGELIGLQAAAKACAAVAHRHMEVLKEENERLRGDKWISVKERLPEWDRTVSADFSVDVNIWLDSISPNEVCTAYYIFDTKKWFVYQQNRQIENIKLWQPLPEPPKIS